MAFAFDQDGFSMDYEGLFSDFFELNKARSFFSFNNGAVSFLLDVFWTNRSIPPFLSMVFIPAEDTFSMMFLESIWL